MIKNIKLAFDTKVNSITPTIQTAYEGVPFTPTNGVPYQELYLLPALNDGFSLSDNDFMSRGIFQITLKYPNGSGVVDLMDRIDLYLQNLKKNDILSNGGYNIKITNAPQVVRLGVDGDRIVYAISINYECFVSVV